MEAAAAVAAAAAASPPSGPPRFTVDADAAPLLRDAVFELACVARAHVDHSRQLASRLPPAASAALLPAVPLARFLCRLEAQGFDVCAAAAQTGVWADGRALARVYLQLDLLRHALAGSF